MTCGCKHAANNPVLSLGEADALVKAMGETLALAEVVNALGAPIGAELAATVGELAATLQPVEVGSVLGVAKAASKGSRVFEKVASSAQRTFRGWKLAPSTVLTVGAVSIAAFGVNGLLDNAQFEIAKKADTQKDIALEWYAAASPEQRAAMFGKLDMIAGLSSLPSFGAIVGIGGAALLLYLAWRMVK